MDSRSKKNTDETPLEDLIQGVDGVESADEPVEKVAEGYADASAQDIGTAEKVADSTESTDELKTQLEQVKKDYLYLRAEYDNYRRQSIKERSELLRYAGEKLVRDLLDTLDIFDTALTAEVTPENVDNFVKGVQLTAKQLQATLNRHGIVALPTEGQPFDPSVHEALSSEPTDDVPEGHVSRVFKKPYKYHDKILRPGQVVVARPKPKDA